MKRYDPRTTRTYTEIALDAVAQNADAVTGFVAPDTVMAVVKADAYGHGAVAVSRLLAARGVAHFGVATVAEGLILRQAGVRGDIYLLGAFVFEEAEAIVRGDLVPLVSSPEHLAAVARAAESAPLPARVFVAVDTGMGREGMDANAARELWRNASGNVRLTGITTHLSCADDDAPGATAATRAQTESFARFVESVADTFAGLDDGRGNAGIWVSALNSPGTIRQNEWAGAARGLPSVRGVLHRAGLSLYGIEPFAGAFANLPGVRQALSWHARITLVRDLPAGATIGYGATHTLAQASRIATVAAGYADGYPRRLSNRGTVLWNGQHLPVVGRVSMDQLQVDATDAATPVSVGDTVTLLGGAIETRAFAESIDTTAHEPTCAITARVPRIYTGGGAAS